MGRSIGLCMGRWQLATRNERPGHVVNSGLAGRIVWYQPKCDELHELQGTSPYVLVFGL